jgi:hypothetical protein
MGNKKALKCLLCLRGLKGIYLIRELDNEGRHGGTCTGAGSDQVQDHRKLRNWYASKKTGKTLGKGTFGKVKSAVHLPTGQKVAVKIL